MTTIAQAWALLRGAIYRHHIPQEDSQPMPVTITAYETSAAAAEELTQAIEDTLQAVRRNIAENQKHARNPE